MEIWKSIPGFEKYQISNFGRAKSLNKRTWTNSEFLFLVHVSNNNAYRALDVYHNNKRTRFKIHRLVAELFIGPPPSPKHEINHIDGNPSNNNVNNIEWVTKSENHIHRVRILGKDTLYGSRNEKPVKVITPQNEIFTFKNAAIAADTLKLRHRSVYKVLHGEQKSHRNHKIEYI